MSEILTRNLVGKSIVGTDGTAFGTLYNITMDVESGALRDLVVEPDEQSPTTATGRSEDDRLHIPIDRVETASDRIVIRSDSHRSH